MEWTNLSIPSVWLGVGLILLTFDLIVGTAGYLLWIGLSAFMVGTFSYFVPLNFTVQSLCFAMFTVSFTFVWWRYQHMKDKLSQLDKADSSYTPNPNQTKYQLIGQQAVVSVNIIDGKGRVSLNDSSWLASSTFDIPQGCNVKIIDVKGIELIVEKI